MNKIVMHCILSALILGSFIFEAKANEFKVYDANDQFLGILVDGYSPGPQQRVTIFIPELNKFTMIDTQSMSSDQGDIDTLPVMYESENCSGAVFAYAGSPRNYIFKTFDGKLFETGSLLATITRNATGSSSCIKQSSYVTKGLVTKVVDYPLPFNLPIVYPLRFEIETQNDVDGDGAVGLEDAINALQVVSGKH